ncbi:tripartite tricarboxylate transporter TctB family protein [Alicyclobacillus dauci]|uniref:Tripartite tricarboxylate transporter TctB family protein n=1 Tax=Alicyclobacillus dauci TaxID=1475485 RepID=A0ABY6YZ77_9BACL|nr:tripartite tricarboxylate transporter TctB family protein [Alicyclobacillus dauci]WAH35608.1 tripartite tricarboxylate transporter TctB family protein [Alicyclobacillus dauci]
MKHVRAELFLDIAWIVFAAGYVSMASQYPPAGRLIPMVVGIASIVAGVFQLLGNFIPKIRFLTHDRKLAVAKQEAKAPQTSVSQGDQEGAVEVSQQWQWIAMIWAAGLILGILIIGFVPAIPLFFLVYFLLQKRQRNWKLAVGSAIAMGILTYGVFEKVLGLHLYAGILFS